MKRSIVVNKIESLLNSVDNDKIRLSNKLLADLILNTVEEMGMSAPRWTSVDGKVPNLVGSRWVHEWESE